MTLCGSSSASSLLCETQSERQQKFIVAEGVIMEATFHLAMHQLPSCGHLAGQKRSKPMGAVQHHDAGRCIGPSKSRTRRAAVLMPASGVQAQPVSKASDIFSLGET